MCAHWVNDTFNGPSCLCSPGYKKGDKGCQQCPFGYGGTNCKDNSRLIAVVVGVLAAVIVIGMVGGMIGVTLRSNKPCSGDNEESRLIPKIDKESGPAPGGLSNPVSFPNISFPRPQNICANSSDTVSSQQVTSAPRTGYASYDEDEDPWLEMRKYR
ncbi:mucin-13 [Protopterus annectens]|uniref:mucin-13 n=1 Tax=Protopterus annectens TaxID=7888 RepID=UPI001CFBFD10|nr:mucin-13 [Protopterus annectens]